jgi:glutamate dehydrogenase
MRAQGLDLLSPSEREAVQRRIAVFVEAGAPESLASSIGALRPLTSVSDVADLARAAGWELLSTGRIYHQVGAAFRFDRLRAAAGGLEATDAYERQAVRQLIEDLLAGQMSVTRSVMASVPRDAGCGTLEEARRAVDAWGQARSGAVRAAGHIVDAIEDEGGWSFAKLTIVNGAMRQLAATAQAVG